ncbi:hypothetical protein [Heyndrickxia sporothermodurans]
MAQRHIALGPQPAMWLDQPGGYVARIVVYVVVVDRVLWCCHQSASPRALLFWPRRPGHGSAMSNIVSFPQGGRGPAAEQPVIVTVTDHDGSPLVSIPIVGPEEGVCMLIPSDAIERRRAIAALQYALEELNEPDPAD